MDGTNDRPTGDDEYDERVEQNSPTEKNNDKSKDNKNQVVIVLHAAGNAPIMKRKKWGLKREHTVAHVIGIVKKYIRLNPAESLFLYVNQAFAPAPDQTLKNLYECYATDDGSLNISYCITQAWG